ncbi:MAG: LacI family DNA-binding transcriptional regulator [Opitutales bacterium]|nr:LacI family DNA-binding transcriptional regulator [Opitutales bacterium]
MKERITQKDLAVHLGLSQSGISMALRGDPRIGKATQAKVRAAAEAMGYRPDPVMGALAGYRAAKSAKRYVGTLALLLPCRVEADYLNSPFAAGLVGGVREASEEMGYRCETFVLGQRPFARTLSILRSRGIRGMVVGPVGKDAPVAPAIEGLTIVQVGRGWGQTGHHRVTTNHFDNLRLAWNVLRERGYERIGLFLRAGNDNLTDGRWVAAYLYMQARAGIPPLPVGDNTQDLAEWFRACHPDAIIASDQWLRARLEETMGVRAPADIGFAALGVPGGTEPTSGVFQRPHEIGRVAAQLLDLSLRSYEDKPTAVPIINVINGEWHEGDSLRPPR